MAMSTETKHHNNSTVPTQERGAQAYEALMHQAAQEALAPLRERSPQFYETMLASAFAGPLSRPELPRAARETATVAILSAIGGAEKQLATHVRAALGHGVAPSELLALAEHVALYAGFPRAANAITVIDQIAAEAGFPRQPRMRRVALRDHETVVAQLGESGPPVVLLHALGLDWRMWEQVMVPLAAQGRRVFAYDL